MIFLPAHIYIYNCGNPLGGDIQKYTQPKLSSKLQIHIQKKTFKHIYKYLQIFHNDNWSTSVSEKESSELLLDALDPWESLQKDKVNNIYYQVGHFDRIVEKKHLDERMEDEEKRTPRLGASGRFLTFKIFQHFK